MNLSPRAMTTIGAANAMLIFFISQAPQIHNPDGSPVVTPLFMLVIGTIAAGVGFYQALTNGGTGTASRETMALAMPPNATPLTVTAAIQAGMEPSEVAKKTQQGATATDIVLSSVEK